MAVENILKELHIHYSELQLGIVTLDTALKPDQRKLLQEKLQNIGFQLIDDKNTRIIEKIKLLIIAYVRQPYNFLNKNLSDILTDNLHVEYSSLSALFSSITAISIEKYTIYQKIEYIKELLIYDELSLAEIADKLNYSSAAYLSNQFKKNTGLTPTQFKNLKNPTALRHTLDQIQ
ncbi:AraC family transcriptional regulator [Sphingobacterium sp. SRCM116780]|uniref:helix-turn-helix domain-containing protein n=1 Tax=Sphingobacterium sp. SRCM116780 TaxID=2907623 RepID=UPI001F33F4B4|nr:AraC family transcriptional regulator [Sphingobacterium sp. SRCM116780]UIR54703.1 AraC family transcriptional regulator [Sphingobacterium sp. SRCM116780]